MSHHTASTRRASIEQRPLTPLGYSNPAQSARSARGSLGGAAGLLLRSGHGSRVGGAAAAPAEDARAGASSPQSSLMPMSNRNRLSALGGAASVLPSSRRLTQPAHAQLPQLRSRRAASLNLNNPGVRSLDTPQVNHTGSRADSAASTEHQGALEMLMRFRQRPRPHTVAASEGSHHGPSLSGGGDQTENVDPRGESGVDPDAMAAAMEQGNHELLARVRELAALQGQLLVLQQGTASLQAAVARARRGEDGDVSAPANRSRRGSAAADQGHATGTEASAEQVDGDGVLHPVTCDGCGAGPPLVGRVMKCIECDDYDLCARCYADQDGSGHPRSHQFRPRVNGEDPDVPRQLLLHVLEGTMLREALRRSSNREVDDEVAAQELAEVRAVETISALPRVMWAAGAPHSKCSECALCLEEYAEGEEVLMLSCAHLFHEGCIGPWFVKSLSCPLCQKEVST